MKIGRFLILGVVLAAGCKSGAVNDGYAIDLTITADSSVTDDDLARAAALDVEVSGAESFSDPSLSVAGKFDPRTRSVGLRYKPQATAGTLTVQVTISDAQGMIIAAGHLDVALRAGTQVVTLTLSHAQGGVCGDGVVDPGEACDPGAGSAKPCPTSASDCDDMNSCTNDSLTGTGCQATCTHTPVADATGCMAGTASGVCAAGVCCTGCVKNGVCMPGSSDAKACGAAGNSCFDCTQNSATATCQGGSCSGCDATSCTNEGRTCGTSSCGYNCGGCADGCSSGTITHYACVNKSCQMNGSGNCGLYAACASSSTCATTCTGDNGCVATAWCGASTCKPKVALGGACSAEVTGDHECASPAVCSWGPTGTTGVCTSARCTGCTAGNTDGTCSALIQYGRDPRNVCQGYTATACHQNFCAGTSYGMAALGVPDLCDFGWDTYAVPRTCGTGAYSCTSPSGFGVVSGPGFCNSARTCSGSGTTTNCANQVNNLVCFPCNAAHTGCDETAGFSC